MFVPQRKSALWVFGGVLACLTAAIFSLMAGAFTTGNDFIASRTGSGVDHCTWGLSRRQLRWNKPQVAGGYVKLDEDLAEIIVIETGTG